MVRVMPRLQTLDNHVCFLSKQITEQERIKVEQYVAQNLEENFKIVKQIQNQT